MERVEVMSRFPSENRTSLVTLDKGAARPTQRGSAPRSADEPRLALGEDLEDLLRASVLNAPQNAADRVLARLPRNPLWGSWAQPCTNVMLTSVSSVPSLVPVGAWVAHPKEATLHGQSPPGNNSRRSVAHHQTCHQALADNWLTPSFTSQALPKMSGPDWLLSPRSNVSLSLLSSSCVLCVWKFSQNSHNNILKITRLDESGHVITERRLGSEYHGSDRQQTCATDPQMTATSTGWMHATATAHLQIRRPCQVSVRRHSPVMQRNIASRHQVPSEGYQVAHVRPRRPPFDQGPFSRFAVHEQEEIILTRRCRPLLQKPEWPEKLMSSRGNNRPESSTRPRTTRTRPLPPSST